MTLPRCESPIEWKLYNALIRRGYKVKTQVRCGSYRIDITIGRLAIECDGKSFHSSPDQKKYDKRRSAYLNRNGYSVIRFTGSDINGNINECVKMIERRLQNKKLVGR